MKNIQYLESRLSKPLSVDRDNLRFIKVGVIGFSAQPFNHSKCRAFLTKTLLDIRSYFDANKTILEVVSRYTDLGVPSIAYRIASKMPRTMTVGFTAREAIQGGKYKLYPVDKKIIVGNKFGDESRQFVRYIDLLIKYGGGKQSELELSLFSARHRGKNTFVFRGNP